MAAEQSGLYRGTDCHCCGKKKIRQARGGTGAMNQPGTIAFLLCPECDLTALPMMKPPGQCPPPVSG